MTKLSFLSFICVFFFLSCSDDDSDNGSDLADVIVGGWQLERIRVEGVDCKLMFGNSVPEEYLADEEGCASPTEISGNAKRCVNVEFKENGEGLFLWSEISGQQDAPITYSIVNNEVRYCFVGSACSDYYKLVGENLETEVDLTLDQECSAIYVLRRK